MATVALVDAGGANIGSVLYALRRLGVEATLTADADALRAASHVILPGVGAAATGMARLREQRLIEVVRNLTQPVLGLCLGMQLLFEHSQEGDTPCLGLLPGTLRRIDGDVRVPHMGWNRLRIVRAHRLTHGIGGGDYAYFVHSYAAAAGPGTLAACTYGDEIAAVVQAHNFFGAQFHPERSANTGARLLANFLEL